MLIQRSVLLGLLCWQFIHPNDEVCKGDTYLSMNNTCHPHLDCSNMKKINVLREMRSGFVKKLFLGTVNQLKVVYSYPRYDFVEEDFLHGITMLNAFQHSGYVVDMIGYCKKRGSLQLATRYMKHGSAEKLDRLFQHQNMDHLTEFHSRLAIAIDYISILVFLHDSPLGRRVMCDSNDLNKTLSQFLITDHFRLVVADLDALPEITPQTNMTVKCGHRQLFGDFVAPEQLWLYEKESFNNSKMHGYDEKIDIWKIPDVLNYIIGDSVYANQLRFRLFDLFKRCKNIDSSLRPTAVECRNDFKNVIKYFDMKEEL